MYATSRIKSILTMQSGIRKDFVHWNLVECVKIRLIVDDWRLLIMNQEYENILVPVDGSKQAEAALAKAVVSAQANDAHIDVLNVVDTRAMAYNFAGMSDGSIAYQLVDKATDYLKDLLKKVKQDDDFDNIDIHIRLGNPKTVIAFDFPKDHKNDLLVMGASGMSRLQRAMVGSVTSFVKRNAPCDVLVVRTGLDNKQLDVK